MMMGKYYPTILCKSHFSHIFPFSFFFIHSFIIGRQHVFLLFHEGLKVHLIVDSCIFHGPFSHWKYPKIWPKLLLSLLFFCAIVLRCKVDHMWLIVAVEQALFLSRKVSFEWLLCCILWKTQHFKCYLATR